MIGTMDSEIRITEETQQDNNYFFCRHAAPLMSFLPTLPLHLVHLYAYSIEHYDKLIRKEIYNSLNYIYNGWGNIREYILDVSNFIKRETLTKKNHDRSKNNTIKKELVKSFRKILNDISGTSTWIELKGRKVTVEVNRYQDQWDTWFEFEIDSHALFMWYLCEDMRFILKQFAEELGKSKVF